MKFSLRNDVVRHKTFDEALSRLERTHERGKALGYAEGLFITAPSGAGKTTLINYFLKKTPLEIKEDRTTKPVLIVETPSAPTAKSLVQTIQIVLAGDVISGSTEYQTKRIYRLLKELGVELLIIDEFQHFVDRKHRQETLRVTDWLKSFINTAEIPVVILGLPRSIEVLQYNEQLRRRFSAKYFMKPFGIDEKEERKEFRKVLKAIEETLPIKSERPFSDIRLARRFHFATNGLFDYLIKIVDRSVELAGEVELNKINDQILAQAFMNEIWNDVPKTLNPFATDFEFRRLDKSGEPFESVQ